MNLVIPAHTTYAEFAAWVRSQPMAMLAIAEPVVHRRQAEWVDRLRRLAPPVCERFIEYNFDTGVLNSVILNGVCPGRCRIDSWDSTRDHLDRVTAADRRSFTRLLERLARAWQDQFVFTVTRCDDYRLDWTISLAGESPLMGEDCCS